MVYNDLPNLTSLSSSTPLATQASTDALVSQIGVEMTEETTLDTLETRTVSQSLMSLPPLHLLSTDDWDFLSGLPPELLGIILKDNCASSRLCEAGSPFRAVCKESELWEQLIARNGWVKPNDWTHEDFPAVQLYHLLCIMTQTQREELATIYPRFKSPPDWDTGLTEVERFKMLCGMTKSFRRQFSALTSASTSIEPYAFHRCTSLALKKLPPNVTSIGDDAFYGCTSLVLEELPPKITSIGVRAFFVCTSLALTSLPESLTTIAYNAFRGCTSLALTSLPESLKTILTNAFLGCTSLRLPDHVVQKYGLNI